VDLFDLHGDADREETVLTLEEVTIMGKFTLGLGMISST
jgi:hypothetical protein